MTTPKAKFAGLALITALVVAAIISVPASVQSGMPDISKLPPDQRRWVEEACPRSWGPSLYRSCVKRQLSALRAGIPNISKLPPDQRRWVEETCPWAWGPNLYRSCVKRQLGALGTSLSPSRRVPPPHLATSPKAVPAPPPTKRYDAPKSAATAASSRPDAGGATDNRRRIAGIQRGLASLGYVPGPADGILGPKTRDAIRAFQAREGLPVTGTVSVSLVAALRSASGAGIRRREEKNSVIADQEVTVQQAVDIFERGCVGMSEAIGKELGGSGVKVQEAIRICLLGAAESVERDLKAAKVSAQVRAKHEAVIREIRRRANTK